MVKSPPIALRMLITPIRVGLIPTCSKTTSAFRAILAPTIKKAAEEISAGTSILVAVSLPPPLMRIVEPSVLTS